MRFLIPLFLAWSTMAQLPIVPLGVNTSLASGPAVSNTCPVANLAFGVSNMVWLEASTYSTNVDGAPVTNGNIVNLASCAFIQAVGTNRFYSTGGGSNVNYANRMVMTNGPGWIGNSTNVLFSNSNYTWMAVMKLPTIAGQANKQIDFYRASTGGDANGLGSYDAGGRIHDVLMQGNGSGFINPNFNDATNWHLWTFMQSNNVGFIRRDGAAVTSGTVNNSTGWGTVANQWQVLGNGANANSIVIEWTRVLLWSNCLSITDLSNYESACTNDFGIH